MYLKTDGHKYYGKQCFLLFVSAGNIKGGNVPILDTANPKPVYVNPLPSALMLTGIVVSVSVTAFALALIIRLYNSYGTTDLRRIGEMDYEVKKK